MRCRRRLSGHDTGLPPGAAGATCPACRSPAGTRWTRLGLAVGPRHLGSTLSRHPAVGYLHARPAARVGYRRANSSGSRRRPASTRTANLHSLSNAVEYLRLPTLGWLDKLRLAGTIVYGSKITNWQQLEKIPVRDWLIRLSGRRTFERLWLPLLRASWATTISTRPPPSSGRRSPGFTPLAGPGLKKEMFGYVRGGYDRTIKRFAEELVSSGVQVACSRPVSRIVRRGDHLEMQYPDQTARAFRQGRRDDVLPGGESLVRGPQRSRTRAT